MPLRQPESRRKARLRHLNPTSANAIITIAKKALHFVGTVRWEHTDAREPIEGNDLVSDVPLVLYVVFRPERINSNLNGLRELDFVQSRNSTKIPGS